MTQPAAPGAPDFAWPMWAWRLMTVLAVSCLVGGFLAPAPINDVLFCALGVGVLVTCVARWRSRDLAVSRPPLALFTLAVSTFLAADVLAAAGVGEGEPFPTIVDAVRLSAFVIFMGVTVWVATMRGRAPNSVVGLDSTIFALTLIFPVWVLYVGPIVTAPGSSSAQIAEAFAYGAVVVVGLGCGARYLLGSGAWNLTAIMFALGFGGMLVYEFAIRALQTAGSLPAELPFEARAMVGFACWWVAIAWPDADRAQADGRNEARLRHGGQVVLLPLILTLPMGVLAVQYVQGQTVDLWVLGLALVALLVASVARGAVHGRSGEEWRPTALLVIVTWIITITAGSLAMIAQQSTERRVATDALTKTVVAVEQLDNSASASNASGLRVQENSWRREVARVNDGIVAATQLPGEHGVTSTLRASFDDYLEAGEQYWSARRSGQLGPTLVAVGAAKNAHERLEAELFTAIDDQRAGQERWSQLTRLATVLGFTLTLLIVTILLLRFYTVNRKVELEYLALHDSLTGLPSRLALEQRLRAPVQLAEGDRRALVLLDLDDFKVINDSFGHPVGNELLERVSERLVSVRHRGEFLARVDGDAFGLLLEGPHISEAAVATAERIAAAFDEPIDLAGQAHRLTASVGIVIDDDPDIVASDERDSYVSDRATVMLRNAEVAMYEAKRLPGFSVEVFEPAMHEAVRKQIELTNELREAIEQNALHLVYQPLVDLATGATLGYEALVRWSHPQRGPLSPAEFIPLAERTGLIIDLGGWVLREACRQMVEWGDVWGESRYVSVNVAGPQLQSGALPEQVSAALELSGLNPAQLLLEVTESSLIDDVDASERLMTGVRDIGVRFALDDFGTGYSSLSYLRRFPVQVLKVDKSFIDDVADDESGGALVASIVNMAASLRMRVVAEGIEDETQAAVLRQMGCELGQGFLFSRPLPAADVPEFVTAPVGGGMAQPQQQQQPGQVGRGPLRVFDERRAS